MPVQYQSDPVYNAKPAPNNATTLQNNNPLPSQQAPGGLYGQIDGQRYGSSAGAVGTNYANFERGVHTVGNGGIPTGASANATQWNTNIGPVDTGVDAFRQFGDQYYEHSMNRMRPDMDSNNEALAQSLINRGLQPGTDSYNAEMQRMDNRNNDMMSATALGAEQLGLQAQNQYFNQESQNNAFELGQANQNYGQQFGYDQLANQRGIAQIGANASRASSASAAAAARYGADQQNYRADLAHALGVNQLNENARQYDIGNITNTQQMDQNYTLGLGQLGLGYMNQGLNAFNAQQGSNNNWWNQGSGVMGMAPGSNYVGGGNTAGMMMQQGNNLANAQAQQNQGLTSLAGGLMTMLPFSDFRLKENVVKVGRFNGVNIYDFDYIDKTMGDGRYRGVMAQEVMSDYPDAVKETSRGYVVDYRQLPVDMEVVA